MVCWYTNTLEKWNKTQQALFVAPGDFPTHTMADFKLLSFKDHLTDFLYVEQVTLETQPKSSPTTTECRQGIKTWRTDNWPLEVGHEGEIPQRRGHWDTNKHRRRTRKLRVRWKSNAERYMPNALRQESTWHT